jgi:hypothetical protein
MELIAVIPVIFVVAVLLAWVTKIDLAYLFAPAIFFIVGWEFIFGLLGYLNLGMESLILFIGLTLVFFLVRNRGFRIHLVKSSYAPSTVAFISLSLISLYKSKDWVLSLWDEFTHWGAVVKAMHHFATLGPAAPVDLVAARYPPGISLFQYFVMDFSSGWREGLLFWATHLIVIAIIVSILAKSSYKYLAEIALKLFVALAASSVFFNNFDNIYSDAILALAFGFLLVIAIKASYLDGRWAIVLSLSAGFVTLIKPIGIYFAAAAILINIVSTLLTVKSQSGKRALYAFIPSLLALTTVLTLWTVWTTYVVNLAGSNPTPLDAIPSSLSGKNNAQQISDSFVNAFLNLDLRSSYSVPMSSLTWTIVCGLFFVLWVMLDGKTFRKRNIGIGVTLAVATGGYFAVVLISYITGFGPGEAAGLASYSRYIGTWYQGIFLGITLLIFLEFSLSRGLDERISAESNILEDRAKRTTSLLLVSLLVVATLSSVHNYMLMLTVSKSHGNEVRAPMDQVRLAIDAAKMPDGSKVWIITQHKVGFEYYVLRYEMQNSKFEFGEKPFSVGTPYGEGDIWTAPDRTLEVWSDELRDWDYVVLYETTESFNKQFATLFETGIPESNSVYKVKITQDEVSLVKVS